MTMVSFKSIWADLVLLICILTFPSVDAGKITILDDAGELADIETIALAVCEKLTGTSKQIAHISTMSKLTDYLRNASSSEHKLYGCNQRYLQSLEDLAEVLNVANENVCGDQKLKLIEDYHQKYVSKVRKHMKNQKRGNKIPKVVKLFFMQYVSEINTRCEKVSLEVLAKREHQLDKDIVASLNKLRSFTDALGLSDLSRGYNGMYLLWNMVDNLPLEEDGKFSQYLEKRGSSARLNVQLNDPRSIVLVQTVCSLTMKPVYSRSILAVLRLNDLGYYPQGENKLSKNIQDPKSPAHSLFVATQICETILPLRVYQDQELKPEQIVALTREEAAQLIPLKVPNKVLEEIEKVSKEVPTELVQENSIAGLDRLPAVNLEIARERVETIKSAVESRSKTMMLVLRMIMKNMKNKLKSSLGKYLLSRKSKRNLEEVALEKIDLDEVGTDRRRRRRETGEEPANYDKVTYFGVFKDTTWSLALLLAQLLLWTLKITILLAPSVLLFLIDCLTLGYLPLMPLYQGLLSLWRIPRII